jgi:Zn finger protein HypA/HybF involved in hydrogenase expression
MKLIIYIIAGLLGFLGLMFLIGSQGQVLRLLVGGVLLVAAGALIFLTRVQPQRTEITNVQKIDLSGDVNLQEIRCRSCNAPLSKDEISVEAGAIMVSCSHCGATYQFEEAPKW